MNYIWYPFIEAVQLGYDTAKIQYRVKDRKFYDRIGDEDVCVSANAHYISPLLEYMPVVLYDPDGTVNPDEKFARADINPYHRFGTIFDSILKPERGDSNDLVICDIIVHMLAHVDRICGMSKHDFRLMIITDEIENGCFGGTAEYNLFSIKEKRALAEALLMLYETSNCLRSLDALFNTAMTDFNIMLRGNDEVVFFNPYAFNEREDRKMKFVIKLFLPVDYPYVVHWGYTYGSVGHDESMVLEKFVL
jgi:hypothetical protein